MEDKGYDWKEEKGREGGEGERRERGCGKEREGFKERGFYVGVKS